MSVNLFTASFYLLLFLLMCGTLLCGHVSASDKEGLAAGNVFELFEKVKITKELQTGAGKVDLTDYYSSVILSTDNVFVALARVKSAGGDDNKINVLARYIKISNGNNWGKTVVDSSSNSNGGWKTELVPQKDILSGAGTPAAKGFLAVAKNGKIYILLVSCSNKVDAGQPSETSCKFEITVGTVAAGDVPEGGKEITWKDADSSHISENNNLNLQLKEVKLCNNPVFGNAFLTNENIIFVLKLKAESKKSITTLVRLKNTGNNKFEVLSTEKLSESCHPYIFPWNKSIIKLTLDCNKNVLTKIEESIDMGQEWIENTKTFSYFFNFLKDKQNFVAVTINVKEVLFFTEHKTVEQSSNQIYLWMSDGIRFKKVGGIVAEGETATSISFLFASEELFSLNRQPQGGSEIKSVKLTYLEGQSAEARNTINAWKNADKKISELCGGQESSKIPCFTNGLIGFLFSTEKSNNNWKDEYNNVNAILNSKEGEKEKATETQGGFTFTGQGAGATWPVGEQSENQPYSFTNSGFTLVATVKIENNNKNKIDNSLLGLVLKGGKNRIGLWCRTGRKWAVSDIKNSFKDSTLECKEGKAYSVALVLNTGKISVYVDWEQLPGLDGTAIQIESAEENTHFYFGAESGSQLLDNTDVTITNVLLYNRPFTGDEIKNLQANAKQNNAADTQTQHESDTNNLPKTGDSTTQTDRPVETPATQIATENEEAVQSSSSPPPTSEDSAVRVAVDVLCFMLCGVFTLLGRYVY